MWKQIIQQKTLLITGGTGSFGSTVVQRLLALGAKKIIIFSRDEKKQFDMRNAYHDARLEFHIGDVRDEQSIRRAMHGVDLVFHAAALKQVPTGEFFPLELVRTNILGSDNTLQVAIEEGAERVVILSTDKAVYPINTMGLTKALMEKIMIAHARAAHGRTVLCGVRYGNVMYSRGSVIPLFIEQIKQGKQLTITHKDMTRFMLPLSQSVDLVLYALLYGDQGDIFVRKAPASTIGTLVDALCGIFHYHGETQAIGVRGGEKMYETLVSTEELARAEDRGEYFRIAPESQNINYEKYFTQGNEEFIKSGGYTSENATRLSKEDMINLLNTLPQIQREVKNYEQMKRFETSV